MGLEAPSRPPRPCSWPPAPGCDQCRAPDRAPGFVHERLKPSIAVATYVVPAISRCHSCRAKGWLCHSNGRTTSVPPRGTGPGCGSNRLPPCRSHTTCGSLRTWTPLSNNSGPAHGSTPSRSRKPLRVDAASQSPTARLLTCLLSPHNPPCPTPRQAVPADRLQQGRWLSGCGDHCQWLQPPRLRLMSCVRADRPPGFVSTQDAPPAPVRSTPRSGVTPCDHCRPMGVEQRRARVRPGAGDRGQVSSCSPRPRVCSRRVPWGSRPPASAPFPSEGSRSQVWGMIAAFPVTPPRPLSLRIDVVSLSRVPIGRPSICCLFSFCCVLEDPWL